MDPSKRFFPKQTMIVVHHEDGHEYAYERTDYDPFKWTVYFDGVRVGEVGKKEAPALIYELTLTVLEGVSTDVS